MHPSAVIGEIVHSYAGADPHARLAINVDLLPPYIRTWLVSRSENELERLSAVGPTACGDVASGRRRIVGVKRLDAILEAERNGAPGAADAVAGLMAGTLSFAGARGLLAGRALSADPAYRARAERETDRIDPHPPAPPIPEPTPAAPHPSVDGSLIDEIGEAGGGDLGLLKNRVGSHDCLGGCGATCCT